jgi:lipoate-protein ligase A
MPVPCVAIHPAVEQAWLAQALAAPVHRARTRVWTYGDAAIVLGRAQGVDVAGSAPIALRRLTGGGAVYVGPWMIGTSSVLPRGHPLVARGVLGAYRWFALAHARWLRQRGIRAAVHRGPPLQAGSDLGWACFAGLSPWELGVAGRKITGLAQARRGEVVVLSAGTLLRPTPWQVLCQATGHAGHAACLEALTVDCQSLLDQQIDTADWASSLQAELGRWTD